jgi:hypothetical protein
MSSKWVTNRLASGGKPGRSPSEDDEEVILAPMLC